MDDKDLKIVRRLLGVPDTYIDPKLDAVIEDGYNGGYRHTDSLVQYVQIRLRLKVFT